MSYLQSNRSTVDLSGIPAPKTSRRKRRAKRSIAAAGLVSATMLIGAGEAQAESCWKLRREYVSQSECERRDGNQLPVGGGLNAVVNCNYHGFIAWLGGSGYSISWYEPTRCTEELQEMLLAEA